ncbi:MAG: hypothetical protein OEZ01_17805 [Candidatus Heimdallarchaeota archaeon]|nr:hypothetical protein [Candidatus Heimdallarchaeota archaeon]
MDEFLLKNSSAVFGLLGAFLGGALSFFASWTIKNREYALQIWGKVIDKRIKSHENIIKLALNMRLMIPLEHKESDDELPRTPKILASKAVFHEFFSDFASLSQQSSTWLTTACKRELNFAQDYLVTLNQYLSSADTKKFPVIGNLIRQDFIDISSELEKSAFSFFENFMTKRKLNNLSDWHKYLPHETNSRLSRTALLLNLVKIKSLCS